MEIIILEHTINIKINYITNSKLLEVLLPDEHLKNCVTSENPILNVPVAGTNLTVNSTVKRYIISIIKRTFGSNVKTIGRSIKYCSIHNFPTSRSIRKI